jgi:hypothetical protein
MERTSLALPCRLQDHHRASEILARANNQDHAVSTCSVSAQAQIESQDSGSSLSHMQAGHASCMPRLSLSEPDWRWPQSHASLVLAAAVLGTVHKEAQACMSSCSPVWCWPKYRFHIVEGLFGSFQNLDNARTFFPCDAPCR